MVTCNFCVKSRDWAAFSSWDGADIRTVCNLQSWTDTSLFLKWKDPFNSLASWPRTSMPICSTGLTCLVTLFSLPLPIATTHIAVFATDGKPV